MVGTVPPIIFEILPDTNKPRRIGRDGHTEFTIRSAQLTCGGRKAEDPFEQKLAWFLLSYGDWDISKPEVEVENGELGRIQFVADKATANGQEFAPLGFLSQMVSLQFNELTAEEGTVVHLAPSLDPNKLGIVIPADFRGNALRLWRFILSPNYQ